MQGFKKHYQEKIIPALKEKFGYKNNMQVPTMKKVVLNVGIGAGLKDKDYIDAIVKQSKEDIEMKGFLDILIKKEGL